MNVYIQIHTAGEMSHAGKITQKAKQGSIPVHHTNYLHKNHICFAARMHACISEEQMLGNKEFFGRKPVISWSEN